MGRPPCRDMVGIKKGPWTPEEDIILVSYIQEHGPGNWRSVPTNTGLMRCSKSCRLRWTNYLRPGIKRGNFTEEEEGVIIHLQTLLGNKWASIASYLPQRTDNDIKNYWNTHLKKKLSEQINSSKCMEAAASDFTAFNGEDSTADTSNGPYSLPSFNLCSSTYASSTENISRLLKSWIKPPQINIKRSSDGNSTSNVSSSCNDDLDKMLFRLDNVEDIAWDDNDNKSSPDSTLHGSHSHQSTMSDVEIKQIECGHQSFSLLGHKWMFEDALERTEGLMALSADNCCFSNIGIYFSRKD